MGLNQNESFVCPMLVLSLEPNKYARDHHIRDRERNCARPIRSSSAFRAREQKNDRERRSWSAIGSFERFLENKKNSRMKTI